MWALKLSLILSILIGSNPYILREPKAGSVRNTKSGTAELGMAIDEPAQKADFRSGFVSIIGNPNVGKSTLLNRILGQNLCVCTPKPQTTRQRILGVKTTTDYQIVFSDTPGALAPAYLLQETMMDEVRKAAVECDLIVMVSDVYGDALADEQLMKRLA
jgi:tRNA U34 5-carboxymethylaminomethyl modifying GTPase MnmE/TrmE